MLKFLSQYFGTILIILLLGSILTLIIYHMIKKKKKGKHLSCGCSCEQCNMSCSSCQNLHSEKDL